MELSDEAIEKYIVNISNGSIIKYIEDVFVIFRHPNNELKQKSDAIYDNSYEKAVKDGLLDKKSLEDLIERRNLFTEEDKKSLDKLKSKLEAQKVLLGKTTLVRANQDRIKKVINGIEEEIDTLLYKKNSKLRMSAEVKANEDRSLFLCWACSFDYDGKTLWSNLDEFKNSYNNDFRDKVLTEFLKFYSGISLKTMRFIARHSLWRIRYVNSQKTGEALFGVPTVDYTTDMLNLAYWSNFYDNIYQMLPDDIPSDAVIEDDDALDAYMKNYYEERNRDAFVRKSKNKSPGRISAFDSEEVIVTASNELYQDIDYDKPREAQKIKERADIKKRTKRG